MAVRMQTSYGTLDCILDRRRGIQVPDRPLDDRDLPRSATILRARSSTFCSLHEDACDEVVSEPMCICVTMRLVLKTVMTLTPVTQYDTTKRRHEYVYSTPLASLSWVWTSGRAT